MLKYITMIVLALAVIFIMGCTSQKADTVEGIDLESQATEKNGAKLPEEKELSPPDKKIAGSNQDTEKIGVEDNKASAKQNEINETTKTESYNISVVENRTNASRSPQEPPTYTVKSGKVTSIMDKFDGTSMNTSRYSQRTLGTGSITQNNEIVMEGSADSSVMWNVLYTNHNVDLTKDFTVTVDVELKDAVVLDGAAKIKVAIEDENIVSSGERSGSYCAITTDSSGNMVLRSDTTTSTVADIYAFLPSTAGKLEMLYTASTSELTCNFGGATSVTIVQLKAGRLALRSGVHKIIDKYETGGSGSFIAKFDNLNLTTVE